MVGKGAPTVTAAATVSHAQPVPVAAGPSKTVAVTDNYSGRVAAWIERRKNFPRDLARKLREGVVVVRFELDRRGRVVASDVIGPSGTPWLDRLALSQIRDASPFPRPPMGTTGTALVFEIPMRYRAT